MRADQLGVVGAGLAWRTQLGQKVELVALLGGRDSSRRPQVQDRVAAGAELGSLVGRRHEARAPVGRAGDRPAAMVEQDDVAGQVLVDRSQPVRHPRAQARVPLAHEARVHLEQARAVREAVGVHAADDRHVVHAPGEVRDTGRRPSIPAWPCRANLRDEPSSVPGLRTLRTGSLSRVGIGLPLCLVSSGLGSNVSTWLTPPYMKRTMHALALAGKCGALGASGESSGRAPPPTRRPIAAKNPSPASRVASAVPTKPPAGFPEELATRAAARGQGPSHGSRRCRRLPFIVNPPRPSRYEDRPSVVVNELVHIQNDQAKRLEGLAAGVDGLAGVRVPAASALDLPLLLVEELERGPRLIGPGRPAQRQRERPFHLVLGRLVRLRRPAARRSAAPARG